MHEKRMERRRQRRKAAEQLQQDQEAEMMTMSPASATEEQQEPVDDVVAKQPGIDAAAGHVRQRRPRRRRQKQSAVDNENSDKYENGWAVTRSESEHLAGAAKNNADSMPSRSEASALNHDVPSLTPHPAGYAGVTTPFASRDLTSQPALLHQLTSDVDLVDLESRPCFPAHQSNVLHILSVGQFCYQKV